MQHETDLELFEATFTDIEEAQEAIANLLWTASEALAAPCCPTGSASSPAADPEPVFLPREGAEPTPRELLARELAAAGDFIASCELRRL